MSGEQLVLAACKTLASKQRSGELLPPRDEYDHYKDASSNPAHAHKWERPALESEERRITSAGETRPASPRQGQQQPKAAASNEPPPPEGCPSQQFQWAARLPRSRTARRRARRARTRHLHLHPRRPILPHRMKKHPRAMNIGWTSPPVDSASASVEDRKRSTPPRVDRSDQRPREAWARAGSTRRPRATPRPATTSASSSSTRPSGCASAGFLDLNIRPEPCKVVLKR